MNATVVVLIIVGFLRPISVKHAVEQVAVQMIHGIVIAVQLGCTSAVRFGQHTRELFRHPVGDLSHLAEHVPQLCRDRDARMAAHGSPGHTLSEIAHTFQIGGQVQRGE